MILLSPVVALRTLPGLPPSHENENINTYIGGGGVRYSVTPMSTGDPHPTHNIRSFDLKGGFGRCVHRERTRTQPDPLEVNTDGESHPSHTHDDHATTARRMLFLTGFLFVRKVVTTLKEIHPQPRNSSPRGFFSSRRAPLGVVS